MNEKLKKFIDDNKESLSSKYFDDTECNMNFIEFCKKEFIEILIELNDNLINYLKEIEEDVGFLVWRDSLHPEEVINDFQEWKKNK